MNRSLARLGASLLLICLFLVAFSLFRNQAGKAFSTSSEPENEKQIQDVIVKAYQIEAAAAKDFDTSLFASVFVNDPRGGELSAETAGFIKSVNGDPKLTNQGYLGYKLAYYQWWKQGATKIEELQEKASKENRDLTEEEMKSLVDSAGRVAMPRSKGFGLDPEIRFISISVKEDVATATFDDGPRTNEMTLVKINGRWYIAGNKITSIHP